CPLPATGEGNPEGMPRCPTSPHVTPAKAGGHGSLQEQPHKPVAHAIATAAGSAGLATTPGHGDGRWAPAFAGVTCSGRGTKVTCLCASASLKPALAGQVAQKSDMHPRPSCLGLIEEASSSPRCSPRPSGI